VSRYLVLFTDPKLPRIFPVYGWESSYPDPAVAAEFALALSKPRC